MLSYISFQRVMFYSLTLVCNKGNFYFQFSHIKMLLTYLIVTYNHTIVSFKHSGHCITRMCSNDSVKGEHFPTTTLKKSHLIFFLYL